MNHKLLIKTLELLEETFPQFYHAKRLVGKLGLHSFDGEFFKVIKYLKTKGKIIVGYNIPDNSNREILQQDDEVSITPEGIDFLIKIKLIETNKKLNKIMVWATGVIALATFINVCISLLSKFGIL